MTPEEYEEARQIYTEERASILTYCANDRNLSPQDATSEAQALWGVYCKQQGVAISPEQRKLL